MNYTFGLIGCGNMGSAVARAVSQVTHNGILANRTPQRAQKLVFWRAARPQESAGDKQLASVGVYRYGRTRVAQQVKMQKFPKISNFSLYFQI